jgi:hypothetical protein
MPAAMVLRETPSTWLIWLTPPRPRLSASVFGQVKKDKMIVRFPYFGFHQNRITYT